MVKGFIEGVVWWRGERAYFRYLARASFGRFFVRTASLPKIVGRQLRPLDACQRGK